MFEKLLPAFEAEHLYTPASSAVTASIAKTGASRRILGPVNTGRGSGPLCVYHLKQIIDFSNNFHYNAYINFPTLITTSGLI